MMMATMTMTMLMMMIMNIIMIIIIMAIFLCCVLRSLTHKWIMDEDWPASVGDDDLYDLLNMMIIVALLMIILVFYGGIP